MSRYLSISSAIPTSPLRRTRRRTSLLFGWWRPTRAGQEVEERLGWGGLRSRQRGGRVGGPIIDEEDFEGKETPTRRYLNPWAREGKQTRAR